MSRFKALSKVLGITEDAVKNLSPEVINNLEKEKGLIPYKIKDMGGDLELISPKAKASASFRDLDTIEQIDPEMIPFLEQYENPAYIEHLEAEKGYGAKALKKLEESAKKRGADSAYLNASPLEGGRGLSREEAAKKLKAFYESQGYKTAIDQGTNTMMYKKLGLGAIPVADINPLEAFKGVQKNILEPVVSRYNKLKSYITEPLSKQLDLTKDKSVSKDLKTALDMGLDPINLIPGAAGIGAGALQMLGEEEEE